jgi:hypothetical protein
MKTIKITPSTLIIVLIILAMYGCDKIKAPYTKSQSEVATFANPRNVLLEEFTGHFCVNCPAAALVVENLLDTVAFKGRIIPVAIHALSLAYPYNFHNLYYNFQTPSGTEYAQFFGVDGDPSGMFNRKIYDKNIVQQGASIIAWAPIVQSFMNDTAAANIYISVSNYVPSKPVQASVYINVNWLTNLTGNFNLCLEYTEDSIINTQILANSTYNYNYVFMHVLRGNLLPDFGIQIASNPTAYSSWSNTYNCTLDSALVPKNCHVIAYVINSASNEVIQVQQANLLQTP